MNTQVEPRRTAIRSRHGFTLVECLVTLATMLMVVMAAMCAYIYGLKMLAFTKPKLGASDEARRAVSLLTDEIRSARAIKIGTATTSGSSSTFTECGPFTAQAGNAIQVYPSVSPTWFIRYYWDPSDQKLKRTTNGTTVTLVVANSVSNTAGLPFFTSENHLGTVLSNSANNRVIGMTLQFNQIQYPMTPVGPGNYYDFYQLRTKIARRTLL